MLDYTASLDGKIIEYSIDLVWEVGEEVQTVKQFSSELIVEAVVRCLRVIEPALGNGLSHILPPGMSARFRLGMSLAQACQDLGYKGEIGYQTFLYSNEPEIRALLMYLVEKLPRKSAVLQRSIAAKIRAQLAVPWIPPSCRAPLLCRSQSGAVQRLLFYLGENVLLPEKAAINRANCDPASSYRYHPCADSGGVKMNTRCPPKRVPSSVRFFTLCRLTVQPPQSYSVGGQRSPRQLTGKPAGARPDYRSPGLTHSFHAQQLSLPHNLALSSKNIPKGDRIPNGSLSRNQCAFTVEVEKLEPSVSVVSEVKEYCDNFLPPVTAQPSQHAFLPASLLERNLAEVSSVQQWEAEWNSQGLGSRLNPEEYKSRKRQRLQKRLQDQLRHCVQQGPDSQHALCSSSNLADVLRSFSGGAGGRDVLTKGTRFTHTEKFTFTQEPEKVVQQMQTAADALPASKQSEQDIQARQEEEVTSLQQELDQLSSRVEEVTSDMKKLTVSMTQVSDELKQRELGNCEEEESVRVKKRTIELLPDAENNLPKLQVLVEGSAKRIVNLASQWEKHRAPLIEECRKLKELWGSRELESTRRVDELRSLHDKIRQAADEARKKEDLYRQLLTEFENLPGDVSRSAYTQRILEIVGNIKKQKEEITKILSDTKDLQKEINSLTGKLDRTFAVTDELVFKDAKRDESVRKAYKYLAALHEVSDELKQRELGNCEEEESVRVKKRTIELLPDAENNLPKLQVLVEGSAKRIVNLASQWEKHRAPLIEECRKLKELWGSRELESTRRVDELRSLHDKIRQAADEARKKEDLYRQLLTEFENLPGDVSRSAYTQRILEIVGNIKKQKEEITKILSDTKDLQKEINSLTGKLDRTFAVTDELVFKDAKRDESVRKAYKYLAALHENCTQLIQTIEDTGTIMREIRDLEEQIETENGKKTVSNLEKILEDYKAIRQENSALAAKIRDA
ncbi:UNVERIFIED_CONTAM: hypothetical protein FKN15_069213 [Acipenser sinensis]